MATPVDLGTCWGTPNGQDLSFPSSMSSGFLVVAEAILRRWSTPAGSLIDDPTYGYDLTDLLNDDLSPAAMAYAQQRAGAEAQKDERVLRCVPTITLTTAGLLTVVAEVSTSAGPFKLVASVSAVTTQLLLVQP